MDGTWSTGPQTGLDLWSFDGGRNRDADARWAELCRLSRPRPGRRWVGRRAGRRRPEAPPGH